MDKILVLGANGQDGQILVYKLLEKKHSVLAVSRNVKIDSINNVHPFLTSRYIDLQDFKALETILDQFKPQMIFNLAGFSSVANSWKFPQINHRINAELVFFLVDWIRKSSHQTRFLNASSSEIFGGTSSYPQNEESEFHPITPYGKAKVQGHIYVQRFRDLEGLHLSNAILYNHESPLRKNEFIVKKIASHFARIQVGLEVNTLKIGDFNASRDWGWAPEYVNAMFAMIGSETPADFIISTGKSNSVKNVIDIAAQIVGVENPFKYVVPDPSFIRQVDPKTLVGNPSRIKERLHWEANKDLTSILATMIASEISNMNSEKNLDWIEGE